MTPKLSLEVEAATPKTGVVVAAPFAVSAAWLAPHEAALIEAEWADLAANALEANPFYSPALLIPALDAFASENVRLALVRDARGRLIALAPFAPAVGYSRLPVRYLATWMHEHCFFAVPLIRKGSEKEALPALFDLAESEGAFLRLRHLDAAGPIRAAAIDAAAKTGRLASPSARYSRALLFAGYETDAYLREALGGKKRKELRRLRARLEAEGRVSFETLIERGDLSLWMQDFLTLEASGWKGRAGTALAAKAESRAFLAAALDRAFDAGALDFHRLAVNDRPIAMIVNFNGGGECYSFKIAYDEEFARYSPGVMLEIEMMRALEKREGLFFVDSCAAPDHPMINSLWRERREIEALNVSGARAGARTIFRVLTGLERLGERLRRKTKEAAGGDL